MPAKLGISLTLICVCIFSSHIYSADSAKNFREFADKDKREAQKFYNKNVPAEKQAKSESNSRPANWATPLKCEGLQNFYMVSSNLYRSAQPNATGMRNLKARGIKTIVNMREFHSDRDEIGKIELNYEHIRMKPWHISDDDAIRFLKIATDTNKVPVLVHCKRGADRTGAMCAVYRIVVQNRTPDEAIRELKDGGYAFSSLFSNIPRWLKSIDAEEMRRKIGITAPPENTPSEKQK